MPPDPDYALLSAWRQGDDGAGRRLLGRHFRSLYLFFSNKVSGDVSDLVQDTMLGCVQARDRVREDGSFRAFLLGVARHRLYDHFEARAKALRRPVATTPAHTLAPSPVSMVARRQEQRRLLAALRSIPLELQIVLELHYWEELPTSELSRVLDVPQGTVKSRLRRARQTLTEALDSVDQGPRLRLSDDDIDRWARSLREELDVRLGGEP